MKNRIALMMVTILLLSCSDRKEKYNITGRVEGCQDGDSIVLACSPDGMTLETISQSVIKDGKFSFEGHIKNCGIAYICYEDTSRDVCSMLFLEKGKINVVIDSTQCIVTGTPLNDMSNEVDDSVKKYIDRLEVLEEQFYSAMLNDDELAMLGAEGFNLQEELVYYLRKIIEENIGNLFGLYMLVVYNDFFTSEELDELIARIPPSSINRKNNPLYDIIIGVAQERKTR
ncbi:MAG: DUF4369 domain-containing protein [Bacteroidaceae bacterium]|nr:DUF4369 domain-containing protein [Bacteroidaceae bacterium]